MKRLLAIVALAVIALGAAAGEAAAHPLGNFSINHLSEVRISEDRVDVLYVLDEAEIPTVDNRDVAPGALLSRKREQMLPEDLYPWLTLVSGLLVVVIGAGVLSSRLRWFQHGHAHGDGHSHSHDHSHSHEHSHGH